MSNDDNDFPPISIDCDGGRGIINTEGRDKDNIGCYGNNKGGGCNNDNGGGLGNGNNNISGANNALDDGSKINGGDR